MTMQPGDKSENQEETPETREQEPDPIAAAVERMTRLEADLSDLRGKHVGTANYVGALGRRFDELAAQPPSAARDDRYDLLKEEFDEFIEGLDDDVKARIFKKRADAAAKPKPMPQAAQVEKPVALEDAEAAAITAEYWGAVVPEWKDYAQENKVPWNIVWAKIEPRLQTKDNQNGDLRREAINPSPDDVHGWRPLTAKVKALIKAEAALWTNQQNRQRGIETEKGVTTAPVKTWAQAQKIKNLSDISDAEYEALVAQSK